MTKLTTLLLATGALFVATPSFSADLPLRVPPPQHVSAPPAEDYSGWYLRGDVGAGLHRATKMDTAPIPAAGGWVSAGNDFTTISGSHTIGAGVGYAWNSWLRTDFTAEYRTGSILQGRSTFTTAGGAGAYNLSTTLSSIALMANAYLDLGTWYGLTPYVGAGIGYANNKMGTVSQNGAYSCGGCTVPTTGYMNGSSKSGLAWALMAGVGWDVTRNTKLELGYRYMNMGNFISADKMTNHCNCETTVTPVAVNKLTSHDFRLGMRWQLSSVPAPMGQPVGEPLVRKF